MAAQAKQRVWLPPRTFFTSHKTGLTVTEPIYDSDTLRAVTTVDFDVTELSSFIQRSPFEGSRTLMFAADGTVLSRYWSDVYGNRLYLDVGKVNGHNLTVVYNHATSYRVNVGYHVTRGEIVGYVGSTGWSTGCHLHFTVLLDGNPVDPMHYM